MKRTLVSRSIGRGLAKVEPTSPNTLIAYSAKAGSTAMDGDSKNSPFTIALSKHLTTPGLDVRRAFGFVRDDVLKTTGNRQEPFVYGSLGGDDVPLVPAKPVAAAPAAEPAPNPQVEARRDYELAVQVGNKDALNAFLAQHPDGFYANLARLQFEKLDGRGSALAATEKARAAEAERARLAAGARRRRRRQRPKPKQRRRNRPASPPRRQNRWRSDQAADAERKRVAAEDRSRRVISGRPPQTMKPVADGPGRRSPAPVPRPLRPRDGCRSADAGPRRQADLAKSVAARTAARRLPERSRRRRLGRGDETLAERSSIATPEPSSTSRPRASTRSMPSSASTARVCPPACDHGFKADGDHCSKIVCAEGSFVNDDNECEKRHGKTPAAKKDRERDREADHAGDRTGIAATIVTSRATSARCRSRRHPITAPAPGGRRPESVQVRSSAASAVVDPVAPRLPHRVQNRRARRPREAAAATCRFAIKSWCPPNAVHLKSRWRRC